MSAPVEANRRSGFSRLLRVEEVPEEGLDLSISATEAERQVLAAAHGLEGLAKLEATLHVVPWRKGGLAVDGEMRARITQICVVTLDPFESEIVEPIDVKFAPSVAPIPPAVSLSSGTANRARRRHPQAAEAPTVDLGADDPPDPIIDGQIDLGALVAEFLALGLDPYPRKPGVEFEGAPPPLEDTVESPFAQLEALKGSLPRRD